jgi:hypothetical protein
MWCCRVNIKEGFRFSAAGGSGVRTSGIEGFRDLGIKELKKMKLICASNS